MAKSKGFELVPEPVPPRRRAGFYREILDEFLKMGAKSAAVKGTDRKPVTLVQGLRKAVDNEQLSDVKVVQRGATVYLVRE